MQSRKRSLSATDDSDSSRPVTGDSGNPLSATGDNNIPLLATGDNDFPQVATGGNDNSQAATLDSDDELVGKYYWVYMPENVAKAAGGRSKAKRAKMAKTTEEAVIGYVVKQEEGEGEYRVQWLRQTSDVVGGKPGWTGSAEYTAVPAATWLVSCKDLATAEPVPKVVHYTQHASHMNPDCCKYFRTHTTWGGIIEPIAASGNIDRNMLYSPECKQEVNPDFALFCYQCNSIQHTDCDEHTKMPWQIFRKDNMLRHPDLSTCVCKGCPDMQPVRPLPLSSDYLEPEKPPHSGELYIDIGSHYVRMSGYIDGKKHTIDNRVVSAVWVNKTDGRVGAGRDKEVGMSDVNIMINPIKKLILQGLLAFTDLSNVPGILEENILIALFTVVMETAISHMLPGIKKWGSAPVHWTLGIALPAGLPPPRLSLVAQALLKASQTFKFQWANEHALKETTGLARLALLDPPEPRIVVQTEPAMALRASNKFVTLLKPEQDAQPDPEQDDHHKEFIIVVDLGATTACFNVYRKRLNEPAVLVVAVSLLSGTVWIVQRLRAITGSLPESSVLQAAVDATPFVEDADIITAFKETLVRETALDQISYHNIAEEFCALLSKHRQFVVDCVQKHTCKLAIAWKDTHVVLTGGGTMDTALEVKLRAAVHPAEFSILTENYAAFTSPELTGLRLESQKKSSLNAQMPYHIFFETAANQKPDDNAQCMVLLSEMNTPVIDSVLHPHQLGIDEPIFLEVLWNENDQVSTIPLYATDDKITKFITVNGLRCIEAEHKFKNHWLLASIEVPRPAGDSLKAANLMICNIDLLANTVVVNGTVGVLQEVHANSDNFSNLTIAEFQNLLYPSYIKYSTVCVLNQVNIEPIIEELV